MKAVKAGVMKGLPVGCEVNACDNSGAKIMKIFAVKGHNTKKGKIQAAGVGDLVLCAVKKGKPEMRKEVVFAIVVRQRRPYRRADGTMIAFEDNAAVVLKDDKGNPKGTLLKGPICKEAADRWPAISKLASIII